MIKSGVFIEGVEVTEKHVGKEVVVMITDTERYLPVDFKTVIKEVYSDGYYIADNEGDSAEVEESITLKWATPPKPLPKSSLAQRKKLAKVVRDCEKQIKGAIKACEEVGMVVSSPTEISIKYQSPQEEF